MATRALMALVVLSGGVGCGFSPSGGAADGDGDGSGAIDASQPSGDSGGIAGEVDADLPAVDPCAPADGLVACYQFESNLLDASGEGNDLTGSGYDFASGPSGFALALNEASDIAPIEDASLEFDQALTIEVWIRPAQAQDRWFVDHQDHWGIEIEDDGDLRCTVVMEGEEETRTARVAGGRAADGAWTHVACTYDGDDLTFYRNGAQAGTVSADGSINSARDDGFAVGRDSPDGEAFLGLIDTVRIWSRALQPEELECRASGSC